MQFQDHEAVAAVFSSVDQARQAVAVLYREGWGEREVSLVTRGNESEFDATRPLNQGDEMEKGAAMGAAAGAALGLLASSALLIVPGIGPVLFVGAMASGMTGGVVGGIVGAMSGWGIKEDHVQPYKQELREGKTIVLVTGEPLRLAAAQSILEDSEAERVVLHAETADSVVDK